MNRLGNTHFSPATTVILMVLVLGLSKCGYSGPRTTYIVELNFQSWLLQEANDPSDSQLNTMLAETSHIAAAGPQDKMEAFREALRRNNLVHQARFWFFETGEMPYNSTEAAIFQALQDRWNAANDRLMIQLMARFEPFDEFDPEITMNPVTKRLSVTVNKIGDLKIVRNLIQAKTDLGFYSTFGIREIGPTFRNACQSLIMADTLEVSPDLAQLIHLDQQIVQNKSSAGGQDDAMIGIVAVQDTHQARLLLEKIKDGSGLPTDLKWAWSAKPLAGMDNSAFGLYALRTVKGKPEITGEVVTKAFVSNNLNEQAAVQITMNREGADNWLKMTTANQGRQIAMVIDGAVYSAPYVQEPISGGSTQITGNFTKQEIKELAAALNAGNLPGRAVIIGEEEKSESSK
jgi:SecD/SecF fusion protein